MADTYANVDEYIDSFPEDVQHILREVRKRLLLAVPGAEEKIRYDMPAVMLGGSYAIHYAAWKKHVGLYPVPRMDEAFELDIAPYRAAKDSVNFPYPAIDYDLIERMARASFPFAASPSTPRSATKARTRE
ncbi:DUF1801 domain-containing protein [Glaciihabitans sp. dw_435]|uniref:iron chaperone n=1 Tax=Glaciihabitans sp. dw_435 TaxID=2720081 RepID=UPI001BD67FB0|nr:DUF1801 domain-containing protein [Glaciihabitans sp. dw_435]